MKDHKAETPSESHGHGEILQSLLLFHGTFLVGAATPDYQRGRKEHRKVAKEAEEEREH